MCQITSKTDTRGVATGTLRSVSTKLTGNLPHTKGHLPWRCLNGFENNGVTPNGLENNGVTPEWIWKQWSYSRMGLETMELLQNGFENNGVTPEWVCNSFSMRTVSLAPLLSCHSIDTDAWCERALKRRFQESDWNPSHTHICK